METLYKMCYNSQIETISTKSKMPLKNKACFCFFQEHKYREEKWKWQWN